MKYKAKFCYLCYPRKTMMTDALKFGVYNLIAGACVGFAFFLKNNQLVYALAPGISAFLAAVLFWALLADNPVSKTRVVLIGLFTGVLSHPICWLIWGAFMGKDNQYASIFTAAIFLSFFSLILLGWLTVGISIVIGLLMRKRLE